MAQEPSASQAKPFVVPEMQKPSIDPNLFEFVDVGAKIPNYTPGRQWGTQGAPFTSMQKPLPAESSIKAYSVPKGFYLSLWAKELQENSPEGQSEKSASAGLKGKPIAMNWDEKGRLWVCETIDYPNELQPQGQGRDRIKICEDTDGDGRADKFTIFAQHLSIPSALVIYRGGALVQDGQSTIYLKDIDGDDVADFKQELITGWAMGDTHGGVSNFQYGPDNWIWAMQGYNNSQPVIHGQPQMRFRQGFWRFQVVPGASDATAPAFAIDKSNGLPAKEASAAFHQHTLRVPSLEFMRATNNNTWGLGFSEEGYVFGSTANNCPSVHMPFENAYYDQVKGWSPKTLEKISPDAKFKALDDPIRQVDVHGGYTAACGAALYTARKYPKEWWNRISLVCEPTGHLVGGFVLDRDGASYKSQNLFNAVASIDDWAAPIMAEVGPDGNVWVLDWYNYIVQHNPTPTGFKTGKGAAYESDLRDKRFARVYRLIYGTQDSKPVPSHSRSLSGASASELIEALRDENFFWRRTAQRLLVEKGSLSSAGLKSLVDLVDQRQMDAAGLTPAALHAIWTLAGLSDSGDASARTALEEACRKGLQHPSASVRHAAITYGVASQIKEMVQSPLGQDADTRVQLALLLKIARTRNGDGSVDAFLANWVANQPTSKLDEVLLDAWTSAASTRPIETLLQLSKATSPTWNSPLLLDRISVLADHVARSTPTAEQIEKLLQLDPNASLTIAVWDGLARGWPKGYSVALSNDAQTKIRDQFLSDATSLEGKASLLAVADKWSVQGLEQRVTSIQQKLFDLAIDGQLDPEKRLQGWKQAIRLAPSSPRIVEMIPTMFSPQLPPEIGLQALDSLQGAKVDGLAERMLGLRRKMSPSLASGVMKLLLGRSETTVALLDAIEKGDLQFADLQLDQRQALVSHPDRAIARRAEELMKAKGAMVSSNRQALVDAWMPVTEMKGNVENGIAMYKKHCAQCHKHGELGVAIGPNLTGMAVHPKHEILMNILDPSRSVESNFRTYQILKEGGIVVTGMLAGESANAIRIIDSQGKEQQVLRADIEELIASTKSLMPEGFESSISKQEMADLLAFLNKRGKYTPLTLGTAATLSGPKGLPGMRGQSGDKFLFSKYGTIEVEGVPFELQDPQEGRVANIVALQSENRRTASVLPSQATLPCTGKVATIHLLCAVASFGPPGSGPASNPPASLIVRCSYEDGTSEPIELYVGKHLATYRERIDVPESKFAIDAQGKQVRYLKLKVPGNKPLKSLDFIKGEDFSWPLVFAVTVESSEGDAH